MCRSPAVLKRLFYFLNQTGVILNTLYWRLLPLNDWLTCLMCRRTFQSLRPNWHFPGCFCWCFSRRSKSHERQSAPCGASKRIRGARNRQLWTRFLRRLGDWIRKRRHDIDIPKSFLQPHIIRFLICSFRFLFLIFVDPKDFYQSSDFYTRK